MHRNLSYKNKFRLLLGSTILVIFIVYFLAIEKTIIRKNKCIEIQNQLIVMENAPEKIAGIKQELARVESIIGKNPDQQINFRHLILEKTSNYCESHNIKIKGMPESVSTDRNDYEILTHPITLEGRYKDLVLFIYEMEQNWRFGNIVSARFYTEKNIRTKKEYLLTTLYLQNIKKK